MTKNKPGDIFKDIEAAGEKDQENKTVDLGPISAMVEKQINLERSEDLEKSSDLSKFINQIDASISDIEAALKKRRTDLYNVRQVQIPEYMKGIGLEKVTTSNGTSLEIKDGLSITIKDKDKFYSFVRKQNAGDLIKDSIIIDLSGNKKVGEVIKFLDKTDSFYERKEAIHAATVKKFIKGCMEKGIKIPISANVFEYQYSKIKGAK